MMRSVRWSVPSGGSPWRRHGRAPLDRRISRRGFSAEPQARETGRLFGVLARNHSHSFASPSRRETRGSHPSLSRATLIDAPVWRGSPSAAGRWRPPALIPPTSPHLSPPPLTPPPPPPPRLLPS